MEGNYEGTANTQEPHRLISGGGGLFQFVRSLGSALIEFSLPKVCLVCDRLTGGETENLICGYCWLKVDRLVPPLCMRCGHTRVYGDCSFCVLLPPFIRSARSFAYIPDGPAGQIVYNLKYSGWQALSREVAEKLARLTWPVDVVSERAMLVPVPLAVERLRERGYNQSLTLAQELAKLWEVPTIEALRRVRATKSQTRLDPALRMQNVSGAFALAVPNNVVAGKHLVLIDDVVTTAATLNSCAETLFNEGARTISYVTFGRARTSSDRL